MPKSVNIWGRKLNLKISYECNSEEEVLQSQKDVLSSFLEQDDMIQKSLDKLEKYCLKNNKDEISVGYIDNIFHFVVPTEILVKRNNTVVLMCDYRYDLEHGLALVYKKNKLVDICSQDAI